MCIVVCSLDTTPKIMWLLFVFNGCANKNPKGFTHIYFCNLPVKEAGVHRGGI